MKSIINHISILCITLIFPAVAQAQLADSTRRLMHLQGAVNCRDAGGYTTQDGKTVKWDKVFRSAAIDKLTEADLEVFKAKKIYTVIDFRGTQEAAAAPDRLLQGTDYLLCPAGSDSLPDARQMVALIQKGHFLEQMYGSASVEHFKNRYKPFFQKLLTLKDTEAILFHCTGGRDRTGMANALFLYAMGVPQEIIEADFVASNVYLGASMAPMLEGLAKAAGISVAQVQAEMNLRPELLHIFFDAIRKDYGSIENFLDKGLGIGAEELSILRAKYTM